MPEDCTIQQGDCVSSIAFERGFFWETLWNHPQNATLKQQRRDPNVLMAGDVIHIPDKLARDEDAATSQRHCFRLRGVPAKLVLRLIDPEGKPRNNLHYVLTVDGSNQEGQTDDHGRITTPIPPGAQQAHLKLQDPQGAEEYDLPLGHMDPVETDSGVAQRLTNLGYACAVDLPPRNGPVPPSPPSKPPRDFQPPARPTPPPAPNSRRSMGRDAAIASSLLILLVSCSRTPQGPPAMPNEAIPPESPIVERVRRVDPARDADLDALAQSLTQETLAELRALTELWRGPDPELAARAKSILGRLPELALPLLLDAAGSNSPADDAWLLRTSADAIEELHRRIALRLDALLQDKRLVPLPSAHGLREEQTPPPRRVCDEAYLLTRRLLHPAENAENYHDHARTFLNKPMKERNAEILKARQSPAWQQWLEEGPG